MKKASDYKGFNPPIMSEDEIFPFQINLRLIKNDLIQLLKTMPGERAMRPEFGVGLQLYLFEFLDQGLETTIKNNIINAIEEYDQRVNVSDIIITQPTNMPNIAQILIVGVVKEMDANFELSIEFRNFE